MATSSHSAARVRIAGSPAEARKLAARLSRAGIASALDDGGSHAEVIVALGPGDLASLRARATRLLTVGIASGPALEAGADDVVPAGDPLVHARVVAAVEETLRSLGLSVLGTVPSPLLGPAGNREFLSAARRPEA